MGTADNERVDALRRILRHSKSDPSTHGITPVIHLIEVESIQDGKHVPHAQGQGVRSRIMGFVARPMSTRIHEDELIVRLERIDIAERIPPLQISDEPMLQHERRPFPFDLVVNTSALMASVWHIASSLASSRRLPVEPGAGFLELGAEGEDGAFLAVAADELDRDRETGGRTAEWKHERRLASAVEPDG